MPDPTKDLVRLVIAEAPGAEESEKGEPLVGGSGRLFNKLIAAAGIQREGLTIANCIQCKPPGNVFPTDPAARTYISKSDAEEAIKHCKRSHVDPLLTSRKWNRVDMFGDKPLRIVGGQGGGIGTWRGSPVTLPNGLRGIATYHPSYLMRDQSLIPVAINDLKKSLNEPPEFYRPYPDLDEVRGFKATRFSFDIECPKYRTMGDAAPAEMVGLCSASGFAICVPIRGEYTVELKRIFSNATEVIGHNALQFDIPRLKRVGINISDTCQVYDTMLIQHLLFPDLPHDLEFVGSQFISKPAWKADKSRGWEPYCCRDTDVTFQVWQHLYPMLKKEKLDQLYFNVAVPMAKICLLMHETGFKVDTNQIKFVRAKLLKEMEREEHNIPVSLRTHSEPIRVRQLAPIGTLGKSGKPVKYIHVPSSKQVVPWRSSAVKQRYFYSKDEGCLGLDPVLDPKTGNVTTGKIAIAKLYSRTKNDSIRALGLLNKLDETITTFAKEEMVSISRMYPHFNVQGTASGRLSSSDPNLQNIPESARIIYVPSHVGWKIVDVDYSQIENRLTAYFAADHERAKRFTDDPKFSEHKYAASLFLNIPYEDVVKDNDKDAPYGKAKRIVHGTNYGMGYKKICNLYALDLADTRRLQDTWKNAIRPTILWQSRTGEKAKHDGFLTTPFSRKRWFWTSSYYTEALSFLPQSTAADVIFRAMIGLMYERIGLSKSHAERVCPLVEALPHPARLLIQVHDSLIFECPISQVESLVSIVTRVMCQPWPELGGMTIPIGVKVGDNWGEED